MHKTFTLAANAAIVSGLFLVTGCSSEDGGGGASVPANAVIIDNNNAEATVLSATASADILSTAFAIDTTQIINLKSTLDLIKPKLDSLTYNSSKNKNIASGIDFSEPCSGGGSISGSGTESDDGTSYSESGNVSFNNCIEDSYTINGSLSYSGSGNYSTGAYTDNASGSMTMSFNGGSDSFSFSGFSFAESGNNLDFTYTINQFTYAIDFVINGTAGGGFLVTLTAPIVETTGDLCPESGHITITGGNGTTAEGIFNGDGTVTIKANGSVVNATASCYF